MESDILSGYMLEIGEKNRSLEEITERLPEDMTGISASSPRPSQKLKNEFKVSLDLVTSLHVTHVRFPNHPIYSTFTQVVQHS